MRLEMTAVKLVQVVASHNYRSQQKSSNVFTSVCPLVIANSGQALVTTIVAKSGVSRWRVKMVF